MEETEPSGTLEKDPVVDAPTVSAFLADPGGVTEFGSGPRSPAEKSAKNLG